jgi:fibronectin-binding autotransporter adhesin
MTTISSGTTIGITLTSPTDVNPIIINSGVTVSNKSGTGVYASIGSWTIQNNGRISGTVDGISLNGGVGTVVNSGTIATTGTLASGGVVLGAGGSVTNAAAASIKGLYYGVQIAGAAGTVVNSGTIAAT